MFQFIVKGILIAMTIFGTIYFNACKPNNVALSIERFEYLDVYSSSDYKDELLNNRLLYKAYVIHGYNEKCDKEINDYLDNYVCDSILPNLQFDNNIYLTFYKTSKNTNRKNFQKRIKNKIIHAKSYDQLLFYSIGKYARDTIVSMYKQKIAGNGRLNPPPEDFHCN